MLHRPTFVFHQRVAATITLAMRRSVVRADEVRTIEPFFIRAAVISAGRR
jgi:hypothetical protein